MCMLTDFYNSSTAVIEFFETIDVAPTVTLINGQYNVTFVCLAGSHDMPW